MMPRRITLIAFCFGLLVSANYADAQNAIPPYDLWTDQVMQQILDGTTLDYSIEQHPDYAEVYFTSNPAASFFDAKEPYAEHNDEKIRIHGYLTYPIYGIPPDHFPAVIISHGHGEQADLSQARLLAGQGYVALAIDGPQAGKSTGGPADDIQAWISVDKGAQYGYLYHYAYACMRAVTLLQALAGLDGNPYMIDSTLLGAIGVSTGGMITSYMNGVDSRLLAAIVVSSAGNWQHTLRINNSWLYHDIYTGTRNPPYNGNDPLNSIADVDWDSTLISFLSHFDPIRYAGSQYAPVMTIIGTHDEYFPLPNANLMELANKSSNSYFQKRLWLLPNATQGTLNLLNLSGGIKQWLDYCFGKRAQPLATPQISLTETSAGLSFDIVAPSETAARLSGASVELFLATQVDSSGNGIADFSRYPVSINGTHFVESIPAGGQDAYGNVYTAQNVIYYATITDVLGLTVSSLVYKGKLPMDLSTDFVPVIEHSPNDQIPVPVPPDPVEAARTVYTSVPLTTNSAYQGMALTNPTDSPMAVRIEGRTMDGRIAASDYLINPVLMTIPPRSSNIFLSEQWLGLGAYVLNGSFQIAWNKMGGTSLAFRGNGTAQLDGIGPLAAPGKSLWLPLVPELDGSTSRKLRFSSISSSAATVTITYRTKMGVALGQGGQIIVPAWGAVELDVSVGSGTTQIALAQLEASAPISARMEVRPNHDLWSVEALPAPSATKLIQPHAEWNGSYKTIFAVINTNTSPVANTITFTRHKPSGDLVGTSISLTLNTNQTADVALETLFQIGSQVAKDAGWIEADTPGGVIIQAIAYNSNGAIAASPLGSGDAGILSMPFFVDGDSFWTGLAMANASNSGAYVTIAAYSDTGDLLGQNSLTLGPGQSKVDVIRAWISGLPDQAQGQIVISTNAPLSLLAYIGSNDGASIAAIPFTLVTP